jgi:hypothetical protein
MFNDVSANGSSNLLIQIGSGSIATSGYLSGSQNSSSGVSSTAGFLVTASNSSSYQNVGNVVINYMNNNTYTSFGAIFNYGTTASNSSGGAITLSGIADRVRITTVNGTDTFDAGSINIMYEG